MRQTKKIIFKNGRWWFWLKHRNPFCVVFNTLICCFSIICPFPEIKNTLLRLIGMKIGKNVFIAMGVALDIFYPELIEIGENTIIGYGCVITAHELLPGQLRIGKIKIGRDCMIGTRSVVLPGVSIGAGSIVSAMSLINKDIPCKKVYGGVPASEITIHTNKLK